MDEIMGMLSKSRKEEYINDSIKAKIHSQLFHYECDVRYYFKHRHVGLAGISNEMVAGLCHASARKLRVWREIANECKYILNED